MEREETVQRCVADHVVAADPDREVGADERDRREQVDDHLRAPVRHLAPGQQVAHERLGHQAQEDQAAEDPDQLARLAVRAVEQSAEHVQVDDDEERRRASGVHVANQPAPRHVAHDVLDRRERLRGVGLVVHDEHDAGDDLDDQHQHRQRAEEVPEVEVLRRVVLGQVLLPELRQREAGIDPAQQTCGFDCFFLRHLQCSPRGFTRDGLILGPRPRHGRRGADLACRSSGLLVVADQRARVGQVHGGTLEVVGRGLFLKRGRQVERGAMARGTEAANSRRQGRIAAALELVDRRAAVRQMPTTTVLEASTGIRSSRTRAWDRRCSEFGSATLSSVFFSDSSISGVRRTTQTGLLRHSTRPGSPGFMPAMSTSTGAPAALAFSEGASVLTGRMATATVPTAPAAGSGRCGPAGRVSGLGESLMTSLLEMMSGGIENPILACCND